MSGAGRKCYDCKKTFPLEYFGTRVRKGVEGPYANCPPCRDRIAARSAKYHDTAKGKASQQKSNASAAHLEANQRFRKTEKGKAATQRSNSSLSHKSAVKKYSKSSKGVASSARYWNSDKGRASKQRGLQTARDRRSSDDGYAMMHRVKSLAASLLSGKLANSPTFVARTSFDSCVHFRKHLKSTLPTGLKMSDHGIKWEVDHIIPQQAYDFSNPEDVKKCWSPSNVRAVPPKENNEKKWKIIDELCAAVRVDSYPISWNGTIPNDIQKKEFYSKCLDQYDAGH
jgi:hypothetical protein